MSILCALGLHRARSMPRWNGGYYFSTCARCGRELVRTPFEAWHPVPRGFRVVWSPTPPPRMRSATLTAAPEPLPTPTPAPPPVRTPAPPSPSEIDSATRDSDLPIAEVLRLLREADQAPVEPDLPAEPAPAEAEPSPDSAPLELLMPATISEAEAGAAAAGTPASPSEGGVLDDDFMKEDPEFWGAPAPRPDAARTQTPAATAQPDATAAEPAGDQPGIAGQSPETEPLDDSVGEPAAPEAPVEEAASEPEAPVESEREPEPEGDTAEFPAEPEIPAAAEPGEGAAAEPEAPAPEPEAPAPEVEAETETEPETDALELPASLEMAAIAEPGTAPAEIPSEPQVENEPPVASEPAAASESLIASGIAAASEPLVASAAAEPAGEPVPTRSAASWPSAAPSQDRTPIMGMDGRPRSSVPLGLAIAGALILGAIAVLLFTRVPHPEPSGARSPRSTVVARSAPAVAGQPAYVTVGLLTCHASSVLQARTVRILSRGEEVQVLAREPGWASVMKDGRQCWVVDRYVSSVRPAGRGWLRR